MILFGILLFLVGSYGVYDSYMIYKGADSESLLRVKSSYGKEEGGSGQLSDSNVAWLTLDGTSVDYPVMQGKDNMEFLNKDPFGNYALSGSIFLDSRNNSDFSDEYSLIYGHHMSGGAMFGALDRYHHKRFLMNHSTGTILTKKGKKYRIRLFAVLNTDASDEMIFIPGRADPDRIMEHIRRNSEFYIETDDGNGGNILALSTCKYPDTTERTVVLGRILPESP